MRGKVVLNKEKKTHIVIFNPKLARHLLKNDYILTDIKPHRNLANASVFVFLIEEGIQDEIKKFK